MKISRMISCAALAAMLIGAAAPAPAAAQVGGLLKRKLKEKAVQTVGGSVSAAAAAPGEKDAGAAPTRPGPRFTENVLEMTPELLDRFEKGVTAEIAVRDDIDRALGKLLPPLEYERCEQEVMRTPEAQQIYMGASDLTTGEEPTLEQLQKASEELARRFDKIVRPKCGLDTQQAEEVRTQHADRLDAAGPAASGLTKLQLTLLKERIIPFCTAAQAPVAAGGEVRIPTSSDAIFWVYTAAELEALQPRCARLASALKRGA